MIGLTLVTVVAVLGAGLSAATRRPSRTRSAPTTSSTARRACRSGPPRATRWRGVPGVTGASHVRSDTALVHGEERTISGIDPATIAHFYTFDVVEGSEHALGQLGTDGAIVTKDYAESQHLTVGAHVAITTPSGDERTLVVRGIYDPPKAKQLLGDVSMTQQGVRRGVHASRRTASRSSTRTPSGAPSRPRRRASATPRSTPAPTTRRTPPRTWPRCWRCSTCCWASR